MNRQGRFIVLEGGDGAGTTTNAKALMNQLITWDAYRDVLITHEPTWRAKEIRERLKRDDNPYENVRIMANGYIWDRVIHQEEIIKPDLKKGIYIIGDRFRDSTNVYQWAQGMELEELMGIQKSNGIITPDLTILLDIDAETSMARTKKGGIQDKFERNKKFVQKVIENYREIYKMALNNPVLFGPMVMVDSRKGKETVMGEIRNIVAPYIRKWDRG